MGVEEIKATKIADMPYKQFELSCGCLVSVFGDNSITIERVKHVARICSMTLEEHNVAGK